MNPKYCKTDHVFDGAQKFHESDNLFWRNILCQRLVQQNLKVGNSMKST